MNVKTTNSELREGYYVFLKNLTHNDKLKIISDLSDSMLDEEQELRDREADLQSAFNSFDTEGSAEELIKELRDSRCFDQSKKIDV